MLISTVLAVGTATGIASAAGGETYDQYSLMNVRSAGQLVDSANIPASQWAWNPTGNGRSEIRWDSPANWDKPATGVEHFVRDGDWLYLDGYEDKATGAYNPQRVTSEQVGDGNCARMTPLPSHGGQQHYVRWNIPTTAYCLLATGTITTKAGVVHFQHRQIWRPATTCTTKFLGTLACIEQQESWWDDNGHPLSLQIERTQKIGRGKGPGVQIHSTVGDGKKIDWTADMRNTWTW